MFCSKIDGVVELLNEKMLVENMDGHAFAQHIKPFLDDWSMACAERTYNLKSQKSMRRVSLIRADPNFIKNYVI